MNRERGGIRGLLAAAAAIGFCAGCTTGVEDSPQPAIVRLIIHSDPADTTIVVLTDTITVSERDSIDLTVFQGKAFTGSTFAILYRTLQSYRQEDARYNVLARDNGAYRWYQAYESYVPPGQYTEIEVGLTASVVKFQDYGEIRLQLPPGAPLLMRFPVSFQATEGQNIEIELQISTLQSLVRYRDLYYFDRKVAVVGVRTY